VSKICRVKATIGIVNQNARCQRIIGALIDDRYVFNTRVTNSQANFVSDINQLTGIVMFRFPNIITFLPIIITVVVLFTAAL